MVVEVLALGSPRRVPMALHCKELQDAQNVAINDDDEAGALSASSFVCCRESESGPSHAQHGCQHYRCTGITVVP